MHCGFNEVSLQQICSQTNEKVPIIMDNCGPHGSEVSEPYGQVHMIFWPPNCISIHQTIDQGIIQAVKKDTYSSGLKKCRQEKQV